MESPLHIPPNKKWKGLTVFCYKCKTNVYDICKETGKPLPRCPYGDRHAFKVYIHVPGTDNARRTKKLNTRDLNEAIKQAIEFEKEVKEKSHKTIPTIQNLTTNKNEVENTPRLLVHALARYIGFLHNEGVPAHRKKDRSAQHIKDVERAFESLVTSAEKSGHNISSLTMDEINDELVGRIYEYLLNEKKFANRSFNKYFSYYTSFLKWYNEEYNQAVRNWFERVKRKKINSNPESITKDEYERLLEQIKTENGIKYYEKGVKPTRNIYRPWLADGIRLGLETGRRREEVINLKFNNIIKDGNGNSFIKVEDYKVNRIQNRHTDDEKKFIFIPVTSSLQALLDTLGYERHKGTNNFVLAPELKISRIKAMSDVLSRGFTHYYDQLNTGRKLTFKCLRKTYITNLSLYMGGSARAITQHSNEAVIEEFYLDKSAIAKAAQGFNVFSQEYNRKNELDIVRKNEPIKQRYGGIEK